MVGGDEDAYARIEPVLRVLGTPTRIGKTGRGSCSSSRSTSAWRYRRSPSQKDCCWPSAKGSTLDLAAKVMAESQIGSPMLKLRVPLILDPPDEAWFDIGLMHKDIRLARQAGAEHGTPLPTAGSPTRSLPKPSDLATPTATSRPSTTSLQAYQTIPLPSPRKQSPTRPGAAGGDALAALRHPRTRSHSQCGRRARSGRCASPQIGADVVTPTPH